MFIFIILIIATLAILINAINTTNNNCSSTERIEKKEGDGYKSLTNPDFQNKIGELKIKDFLSDEKKIIIDAFQDFGCEKTYPNAFHPRNHLPLGLEFTFPVDFSTIQIAKLQDDSFAVQTDFHADNCDLKDNPYCKPKIDWHRYICNNFDGLKNLLHDKYFPCYFRS